MWLTIFQTVVFLSYTAFLWWRFKGPLPSYSDSWYRLQDPWNSLFWVFCIMLGVSMCFQGSGDTVWFFLSGCFLCIPGTASAFKASDKTIGIIHTFGAITGIMAAFAGFAVEYHMWWPLIMWFGVLAALTIFKVKNKTWWEEFSAFVFIVLGFYSLINA